MNGGPELWSIDPVTGAGTFETLFDVEGVMGFGVDSDDNFFLTDWVFAPNLYSLDPVSGDTAVIGPVASIYPHGGDVFEACSFPPTFLEATGVCPGTVTFQVTDATPGATLAIVRGTGEGKVTVPFGPCPGIQLGLSGSELVTTVVADPDGSFLVAPTLGGSTCGVHLQVMDTASCTTTNVVQVPD